LKTFFAIDSENIDEIQSKVKGLQYLIPPIFGPLIELTSLQLCVVPLMLQNYFMKAKNQQLASNDMTLSIVIFLVFGVLQEAL